jgi:hypothetical protein
MQDPAVRRLSQAMVGGLHFSGSQALAPLVTSRNFKVLPVADLLLRQHALVRAAV